MRNIYLCSGVALLSTWLLASCTQVSPPRDQDSSDAATLDSAIRDSGPAASGCAEEFIAVEADSDDGGVQRWCSPLTSDGLAIDVVDCQPMYTTLEGAVVAGGVRANVAGTGALFSTLGLVSVGVSVEGRGLSCGAADTYCIFRSGGAACRAVITQAGTAGTGARGALELREPCVLTHSSGASGPEYQLTIRSLYARGTVRLRNELSQPSDDAGRRFLDCGER